MPTLRVETLTGNARTNKYGVTSRADATRDTVYHATHVVVRGLSGRWLDKGRILPAPSEPARLQLIIEPESCEV